MVQFACARGFRRFAGLAEAIALLPYGRVADSGDLAAPLKESKGTCSSKHRLLAVVAHECGRADVQLVVGLYEMSQDNTPGIAAALGEIRSIPEAHCYLMHEGARLDFTGLPRGTASAFDALIEEHIVAPAELPTIKIVLHKRVIAEWAQARGMAPDQAWAIREQCIAALVRQNP